MADSADTKAYDVWVQTSMVCEYMKDELPKDIRFEKINIELCYMQGYVDGMADSGELSLLRYERLQNLIEAHIERNRKEAEEVKNVLTKDK